MQRRRFLETLDWIHSLSRFGIRPGLERITALLDLLGNPHHELSYIHVGGTNGKGSTAAMLASIFRAAGYRAGLYTSPYLLSFTNRMAVGGSDVDEETLVELAGRTRPLVEEVSADPALGPLTEFEVVTALAFAYFARHQADPVVLEVGLGGRLDATNVVTPLLSVITNISLEHTDVLGDTIGAVAAEKAGIIKPNKPLLTAAEDETALDVFRKRCRELKAPFYRVYPCIEGPGRLPGSFPAASLEKITVEGQRFNYHGFKILLKDLFSPLRGLYQLNNAATALAAAELLADLGYSCNERQLREGLSAVKWPGRLEVLQEKPLLILDGAHNPAAMTALSESFERYFSYRRLVLVVGMLADKDVKTMLGRILPLAHRVIFTRPLLPRAADPAQLASCAADELNLSAGYDIEPDHCRALDRALLLAAPEDAILVTGSLYTVSDVRACYSRRKA